MSKAQATVQCFIICVGQCPMISVGQCSAYLPSNDVVPGGDEVNFGFPF